MKAAHEKEKVFFDAWCDSTRQWTPKVYEVDPKSGVNMSRKNDPKLTEDAALNEMAIHLFESETGADEAQEAQSRAKLTYDIAMDGLSAVKHNVEKFKEVRERIYKAARNRALFVTEKGSRTAPRCERFSIEQPLNCSGWVASKPVSF